MRVNWSKENTGYILKLPFLKKKEKKKVLLTPEKLKLTVLFSIIKYKNIYSIVIQQECF